MTVHVGITTVFSVRTPSATALFEHADSVMEELLLLEAKDNIMDSAVSADHAANQVTIELVGCGSDGMDALLHGITAMRSAIHAAGGATPHWPTGIDQWIVVEQSSSVAELADA